MKTTRVQVRYAAMIAAVTISSPGCQPSLSYPDDIRVTCQRDKDCPTGLFCPLGLRTPDGKRLCTTPEAFVATLSRPNLVIPAGQTEISEGNELEIKGYGEPGATVEAVRFVDVDSGDTIMLLSSGDIQVGGDGSLSGQAVITGLSDGLRVAVEVILSAKGYRSTPENSRSDPVIVDLIAPAPPVRDKLVLHESVLAGGAVVPGEVLSEHVLQGLAGAVVGATRLQVFVDATCTILLATLPVRNDGSIEAVALETTTDETYYLVAVDEAGNASENAVEIAALQFPSIQVSPSILKAGLQANGELASIELVVDSDLAANPTVRVGDTPANFAYTNGDTYTFTLEPTGDEPEGVDAARLVVIGEDGRGIFANGTTSADFAVVSFDFSPPTVNSAGIHLSSAIPGDADQITGDSECVLDNIANRDEMTMRVSTQDGSTHIGSVPVNADGSFGPLSIGDNLYHVVALVALDSAGNASSVVELHNDIAAPQLLSLAVTPEAQSDGGTLTVTFDLVDQSDLFANPSVQMEGRSGAQLAGSTSTAGGVPISFVCTFVVQPDDAEGKHTISIDTVDVSGNATQQEVSVVVDRTAPLCTVRQPTVTPWNGQPAIEGTASDDRSGLDLVEIALANAASAYWDGSAFVAGPAVWTAASGTEQWEYSTTEISWAAGSHTLSCRATDMAGNTGPEEVVSFDYAATLIEPPQSLEVLLVADGMLKVTWQPPASGPPPSGYFVYYDLADNLSPPFLGTGAAEGDAPVYVAGANQVLFLSDLNHANYTISVTAEDSAGAQSAYAPPVVGHSRFWTWRNPRYSVSGVKKMEALGNGIFVAAGLDSLTWRSVDYGATWEIVPTGAEYLSFPNLGVVPDALFYFGGSDVLARSEDQGQSWTSIGVSHDMNHLGYAGGAVFSFGSTGIRRSEDLGLSWEVVTVNGSLPSESFGAVATEGNVLVAVGTSWTAAVSVDNGDTWTATNLGRSSGYAADVAMRGQWMVAVGSNGGTSFSLDGGTIWTPRPAATGDTLREVVMTEDVVIAWADRVINRSVDSGLIWSQTVIPPGVRIKDMAAVGNTVVAVGDAGLVLVSRDQGETWISHEGLLSVNLETVAGVDGVWVAGGDRGSFLRSMDDGLTWLNVPVGTTSDLRKVWADSQNVVAVGQNGAVIQSTDAGVTWTDRTGAIDSLLLGVWGEGPNWVAVGGSSEPSRRVILHSNDGGGTWQAVVDQEAPCLSDTYGVGLDVVAVGREGTLMSSNDGGTSWTIRNEGQSYDFEKVSGNGTRFVVGDSCCRMHVSEDHGESWSIGASPGSATGATQSMWRSGDTVLVGCPGTFWIHDLSTEGFTEVSATSMPTTVCCNQVASQGDDWLVVGLSDYMMGDFTHEAVAYSSDSGLSWYTSDDTGTVVFVVGIVGFGPNFIINSQLGSTFHSVDGGQSWFEATRFMPNTVAHGFDDMVVVGPGNVVGVGSSGVVLQLGP